MNKSILIVGAGFGQVPAIEASKKIGIESIVVDKNPYAVGSKIADIFYNIDVIDKEGVLAIAKKHNVSGVMTMQSDLPVPTIGYINDELNLNGVSFEVANFCSNKLETRKRLENKSSQPKFEIISSLDQAFIAIKKIGLPCVIKAPDSSGSRGVTKVSDIDDIEKAYFEAFKFSRQRSILIEEFVEGLEFGAQTFSVDGNCVSVFMHGDTMSAPPYMLPVGHSFPFTLINEQAKKLAITDIRHAIEAIGVKNGPANVDLILDIKTNRVKVIEIGARIGATCLPELIYYHTGINWVEQTILNAVGEKVNLKPKFYKPVAARILESPSDGVFQGYSIEGSEIENQVLEFEITAQKGDYVNMLRKGTDRIGKVLAYGNTSKEAEILIENLLQKINIQVQ
jgi:biotin carboxylase